MAKRPVFVVAQSGPKFVNVKMVNFKWVPGMAKSQKQKCVESLHSALQDLGERGVIEVSSKSLSVLGRNLSAFKLGFKHPRSQKSICVESAFQGSKVFEGGGPFPELYAMHAAKAKKIIKERSSGKLIGFNFYGQQWPLRPYTLFYDWLYINSMNRNSRLTGEICEYTCFTDIEFNPKKSINCQACAAALFVSLCQRGVLDSVISNRRTFAEIMQKQPEWIIESGYIKEHI